METTRSTPRLPLGLSIPDYEILQCMESEAAHDIWLVRHRPHRTHCALKIVYLNSFESLFPRWAEHCQDQIRPAQAFASYLEDLRKYEPVALANPSLVRVWDIVHAHAGTPQEFVRCFTELADPVNPASETAASYTNSFT